jgi:hypothetical protein
MGQYHHIHNLDKHEKIHPHVLGDGLKDNVMDTDRVLRFLDLAQSEFEAGCETWMWREYGGRKRVARIVPVYDMTRRAVTLDAIY